MVEKIIDKEIENQIEVFICSISDLKEFQNKEKNLYNKIKNIISNANNNAAKNKEKKWEKIFGDDDKLLRMYAHALFNQGVLTGEDITSPEGVLKFQ